jgi:5-methylcytosine-specific restriction endonuclease McrA
MTRVPTTVERLAALFLRLRLKRRRLRTAQGKRPRGGLSDKERAELFKKTGGRCHICGGLIEGAWQADHVFAHSCGGAHAADNYLPAHAICNNYRWDYSAEEFQWILKIGVWARKQVEDETSLGQQLAKSFLAHEHKREKRRS